MIKKLATRILITCLSLAHLPLTAGCMSLQELLKTLNQTRKSHNVPALGLALMNDNRMVWIGAQGVIDITTNTQANPDTLFRIGSITKSFTALGLLILQERKKLDLHDPVSKYLPDLPYINPWEKSYPITIAELLEQTAGFQDMSQEEFSHSDSTPLSLEQGLRLFAKTHITQWPPGKHFSYSNINAGIAGRKIEVVAQQTYESFIEQEVFTPLGMNNASLMLDADTHKRLATGYEADGHTVIPYWHMTMRPFGAINASVNEMSKYLQMLVNRGAINGKPLVTFKSIERIETPTTSLAARAGLNYGYGLGVYSYLHNGVLFYGHGGDADGYLSRLGYVPERKSGYFLVINAFNNDALEELRAHIEDYISKGSQPLLPKPATPDNNLLMQMAGNYTRVTQRYPQDAVDPQTDSININVSNNMLIMVKTNSSTKLITVNDQLYRRPIDTVATYAFSKDTDGLYVLQGPYGNFKQQIKAQ